MDEKVFARYNELFPDEMPPEEVLNKMNSMQDDPDIENFRIIFCDIAIIAITSSCVDYPDSNPFCGNENVAFYSRCVNELNEDIPYYHMIERFFARDYEKCTEYFDAYAEQMMGYSTDELIEYDIVNNFIDPMKGAYPGFWKHAQEKIGPLCKTDGTHELCALMDAFYSSESAEEAVDVLAVFLSKYPDITIAREFMAMRHWSLGMYRNAIAELESVSESMLFRCAPYKMDRILGVLNLDIKNYKAAEEYYKSALENDPDQSDVLYGYGISLYHQKKYIKALKVFEQCLDEKKDLKYSVNEYVRTLIKLGRYADAKDFLSEGYKISSYLIKKVKSLPNINAKMDKDEEIELDDTDMEKAFVEQARCRACDMEVKAGQFSSEKTFEDDLEQKINSGIPVFGMNLKMYKRKGEYGRQYIVDGGRVDLLCEDDDGNLYVIELKKDSGYDDAYDQVVRYLDWFDHNPNFAGMKKYGIICLSNPSQELMDKVHSSERVSMFNYSLNISEV